MRAFRRLAAFAALAAWSSTSPAAPAEGAAVSRLKLDPALRRLAGAAGERTALSAAGFSAPADVRVETTESGEVLVPCLIRSNDPGRTERRLAELGALHRVTAGPIVVGVVKGADLGKVVEWPEVTSASASYLRRPLLDVSRPSTAADFVHAGSGLPRAFDGAGVVVGVIDTGIDLTHPDFAAADGSRVLSVWDVSGVPLSGQPRTCTAEQVRAGACPVADRNGHGTHVAGIAAGGGRVNRDFTGMAPGAGLVVAKAVRTDDDARVSDDDTIAACAWIFEEARRLGRPAVVNLSYGSLRGPRDGTSELETALTALTGRGRVLVAAAGNGGQKPVHLSYAARGTSTWQSNETEVIWEDRSAPVEIEVWYPSGTLYTGFTMTFPGEQAVYTPPIGPGEASGVRDLLSEEGIAIARYEIDARTVEHPANGARAIAIRIQLTEDGLRYGSRIALYFFGTGTMDAWITNGLFSTEEKANRIPGDTEMTVESPATAPSVVAVAAHTTKLQWTDRDEQNRRKTGCGTVGGLACFNAKGPARDGRPKPDLSAPGQMVAAPLSVTARGAQPSSRILRGDQFVVLDGTSLASAHVAGAVALMLQANPGLGPAETLAVLQSTATKDLHTGEEPDENEWGAGKLYAWGAVKDALQAVPTPDFTLQVSPAAITVPAGGTAEATVGCVAFGGFASAVTLAASGLPEGATVRFSRPTLECGVTTATAMFAAGSAAPGSVTVTLSGSGGGLTRTAALGLTVQPPPPVRTLFVPVVLRTSGASGSFYTSEMTLTNRSASDATLHFAYTSAVGGGSGAGTATLGAGRQLVVPDAVAYLRARGVPIPAEGNQVGTLRVGFEGVPSASDVSVLVRTTTPVPPASPTGAAGLAYAGVPAERLASAPVLLCGLRRDAADRSNVAVQNAGDAEAGTVGLRIALLSGVPPRGSVVATENVELGPGGFRQIEVPQGFFGWARVERTSGSAPWFAYAVVNDNFNSDGSFVLPVPAASVGNGAGLTLPVALESAVYRTEGILANLSDQDRRVRLDLYADPLGALPASLDVDLPARGQVSIPNLVDSMRKAGVTIPSGVAGPVVVSSSTGATDGLFVGARTGNAGGGGRYTLSYAAVPFGSASETTAVVSGLQQTATSRSNLALVNTGEVDGSASTFRIEVFDGATGAKAGEKTVTVAARRFFQENGILQNLSPGTSQAWVRVTKTSGRNPFIAYGVINDGAQPGQRSGDGAFVLSE